jgi:hypothetical protein
MTGWELSADETATALMNSDETKLDVEDLEKLRKIAPNEAEIKLLKEY